MIDFSPAELEALQSAVFSHRAKLNDMVGQANESLMMDVIGVLARRQKALQGAYQKIEIELRAQEH